MAAPAAEMPWRVLSNQTPELAEIEQIYSVEMYSKQMYDVVDAQTRGETTIECLRRRIFDLGLPDFQDFFFF